MPLHELQSAIAASILRGESAPLQPFIREAGIPFDRRLQVYRNNTFLSLTAALKTTFPVVCRLVDERFFSYAADAFIRERPPQAPCLSEYGSEFAEFLAAFPPARPLKYLPDVARLEWAINEASFAPNAPVLDPGRIAAIPHESYAELMFVMHPSCRLLVSDYPVDRIWWAHQPGGDIESGIDLDAGGCRLLVHRQGIDVRIATLDAAGFAFIANLSKDRTLKDSYEASATVDSEFNLTEALRRHLERGTFSDIRDRSRDQETVS